MDIKEIQNLIKFVAKSGATEVKLEMDDVKITIKTSSESTQDGTAIIQQLPVQAMPTQVVQQPTAPVMTQESPNKDSTSNKQEEDKYITIKSPIIGTFYRKPSPDKPMFVEVGSTISKGDVVCIVEAMKLFNEIESEISGKIVKILVDDSTPVEFDQPLFLVDPS